MPYDIDTEITETKSGKPVKRVRFSDEVQNVYHSGRSDENSGSISVENESNRLSVKCSIGLENTELSKELMEEENVRNKTVIDSNKSISDNYANKDNELPSYDTEEVNEPINSFSDDIISQDSENSANDEECIPSGSSFITNDLDELINDTMLMTISPARPVKSTNHFLSTGEPSFYSSSSSSEINPDRLAKVQADVQLIEQKNEVSHLSRKRSLEGMFIEKQTSKLNTCLRKNNSDISSANELKNAVYNAWFKVKNEKTPVPSSPFVPDVKNIIDTSQKNASQNAYETWKRTKRKAKKVNFRISETVPEKTKEELEESKMAFRAWKKKKDELLRHQVAEKYRKEEKERLDSLMNERMRKNDAESAYSAWNSHKAVVIKMEKKKSQWLSEREKEKLQLKMKKNEEAEKMYYAWLRNKVYSTKINNYKMTDDKPPWTPPGKANSLI